MRSLVLVPVAGLFLVCTTADPPSQDPVHDPASSSAVVESEPQPVSTTDGPEYFFAVASQIGVEHCLDGAWEWLDVQPTLGWTTTSGDALVELDALMDLPVLAKGRAGPAPERPPLSTKPIPCPPMQMRSDWEKTPRGVRVHRTAPAGVDHFLLTSVRRLEELKVEAAGERVRVSFENPLPFALTGVRLQMHYEGCYGKPGVLTRESEARTLGPGERLEHEFTRIVEQSDRPSARQRHAAAALVLEIGGSEGPAEARVWADLDVSLQQLGLRFDCD
ncbi:MAG: hypothetical protein R6X02_26280 [Enhygromyxa sp.]